MSTPVIDAITYPDLSQLRISDDARPITYRDLLHRLRRVLWRDRQTSYIRWQSNSCFLDAVLMCMIVGAEFYVDDWFTQLASTFKIESRYIFDPTNKVRIRKVQTAIRSLFSSFFDRSSTIDDVCTNHRNDMRTLLDLENDPTTDRGYHVSQTWFSNASQMWMLIHHVMDFDHDSFLRRYEVSFERNRESRISNGFITWQTTDWMSRVDTMQTIDAYELFDIPVFGTKEAFIAFVNEQERATNNTFAKDHPRLIDWKWVQDNDILCKTLVFTTVKLPIIAQDESSYTIKEIGTVRIVKKTKHNRFGDTILDGRFQLFAMVVLQGAELGASDTGTHYIAYVRGPDRQWVRYNDMNKSFENVSNPTPDWNPKDIRIHDAPKKEKIELLFYSRTK